MSIKTMMLSSAAALAFALPAFAESHSTDEEVGLTGDADCTVAEGAPVPEGCEVHGELTFDEDTEAETEMEMEADAETDMDAETEMEADAETEADTETELATAGLMDGDRDVSDSSAFSGMTVDEIIGMDVHAMGGEDENDVGEIDYVLQGENGYEAVIGIGGFLGLGEYTVSLPLGAFSIDADNDNLLILDGFTEEELEAMPEIDESELESLPGDHVIS